MKRKFSTITHKDGKRRKIRFFFYRNKYFIEKHLKKCILRFFRYRRMHFSLSDSCLTEGELLVEHTLQAAHHLGSRCLGGFQAVPAIGLQRIFQLFLTLGG